ncbi:tetratricopeptide repeat protein [Streptomyces sp. NBC_00161]|uniref:AfsR/SARP family transcriptional regulator n=1 Tax=Streptomyces sp. NBC_00161 TaxID=2975671 RepID=UPI003243FEFA
MERERGGLFDYRILGPLEVVCGGEPVAVTAPKERDLLVLLLLRADQVVPAEDLIDGLWGDAPPTTARTTLQNYIKRLRHVLRSAGCDGDVLATRPGGYVLLLEHAVLDLREFDRLTAAAAEAAERGDDAAASARLGAALALWRGDALAGSRAEQLTQVEAPRLDDSRMAAFEQRIEAELRLGRHTAVLVDIESAIARNPLRERLYGQLMLALYRCGRRGEALSAYQRARAKLVGELGLEPGPELHALHRRVLADDPALLDPRPRRTASAGAADGTPVPSRQHALPAQLPASTAVFTGRTDALRRLDMLLPVGGDETSGAVRIGLVTGQAGAGKTSLAVHWGHRRRDRFPDGQLYVNLRGHSAGRPLRPLDALSGFLQAFGVPAQHIPAEESRAAALYRSLCTGKRILVVLDNARSAEHVRPLFPGHSECLVLVTSRDSLAGLVARDAAVPMPLGVLEPAEAEKLLLHMIGEARGRAEREAVAELTAACAYLPLAIGITAADLAVHPDRSIADQVARLAGDTLSALQVPGDEESAVRSILDMSYVTLEQPAARLFRLLGLVPGPDVPLPAAAALAGVALPIASELLARLTRTHLLEEHAPDRYAFHDLLRAYALERCEEVDGPRERAAALERLHDWYLGSVDTAVRMFQPEAVRLPVEHGGRGLAFPDTQDAIAWLDAERANTVALVQRATDPESWRFAWSLADALRPYMMRRAYAADWLAVASAGLAAAEADGNPAGQAAAHRSLSSAYLNRSDYEKSTFHDDRALELYRRTGSAQGQAATHNSLSLALWYGGRLEEALVHSRRGADLCRVTGFRLGEAISVGNLGAILHELGRLAEAEDRLVEARELYQGLSLPTALSITVRNLGAVLHDRGQPRRAVEHLEAAASTQRELALHTDLAFTLFWLATASVQAGDRSAALDHIEQGFELATGELRAESYLHTGRALLSQSLGNHDVALRHFRQAAELARRCDARTPELRALTGLAESSLRLGRHGEAAEHAKTARALATASGYRVFAARSLALLAELDLARGGFERAERRARRVLDIQTEAGHPIGRAEALLVLGHALRQAGDEEGTLRAWAQALEVYESLGAGRRHEVRALMGR